MSYMIPYRPRRMLGDNPVPIPGIAINTDTYHAGDTLVSNTVEGLSNLAQWLSSSLIGGIGRGLAQSFGVSESTAWLIVGGVVIYLVMQKKGRR